jgi:hypothetical protein
VLTQQVVWSDNKDEIPAARAQSGPDGRFMFAAVERQSAVMRFVPHQPVILQRIFIQHEGVLYVAWRHTKDSYESNSEMDGHALNLQCELSRTPDFEGTHFGICKAV